MKEINLICEPKKPKKMLPSVFKNRVRCGMKLSCVVTTEIEVKPEVCGSVLVPESQRKYHWHY